MQLVIITLPISLINMFNKEVLEWRPKGQLTLPKTHGINQRRKKDHVPLQCH